MQPETFSVRDSQSIYDIALSVHGNMEGVVDLLVLNGLDFDSALPASVTVLPQGNYITKYLKDIPVTTGSGLLAVTPTALGYTNTGNGDSEAFNYAPVTANTYNLKGNQTIFDVALMVSGSMESVIDLMLANGLNFGSTFPTGTAISYEGDLFISDDVSTGNNVPEAPARTRAFSSGFSDGFL